MQDDSLLRIVVGQRMAMKLDNVELSQLVVLGLDKNTQDSCVIRFVLPHSGDVESNQLAVLQMVPCRERDVTDLETLLPFVHAIHPFDAGGT